jgi:FlaA1/EpsC-like NDP-sugar epimerase
MEPTSTALARRVYDSWMRRWVVFTDVLSVTAALLVARRLRFGSLPASDDLVWVGMIASVTVATFGLLGLYRDQLVAPAAELRRTALAMAFSIIGFVLLSFWTDVYVSRSWVALTWLIATILVVASRAAWRFVATGSATS